MSSERENKLSQWKDWIEEQEKSGLSQKKFCEEKNLALSSFVYYRIKFHKIKPSTVGNFSPVQIQKSGSVNVSEIKIQLPNGFHCTFPTHLEISQVKSWVEVLLSC
jgi:hypothetical protein